MADEDRYAWKTTFWARSDSALGAWPRWPNGPKQRMEAPHGVSSDVRENGSGGVLATTHWSPLAFMPSLDAAAHAETRTRMPGACLRFFLARRMTISMS
jgi:hypothetical protein